MELRVFLSKLEQCYAETVTALRKDNKAAYVAEPDVNDYLAERILESLGLGRDGGPHAPA